MTDPARLAALRGRVHAAYALHALSIALGVAGAGTISGRFLFPLPSLAAALLAASLRAATARTFLATHLRWQLRSAGLALLWSLLVLLVSAPLTLLVVGVYVAVAGMAAVGLWFTWRIARGWLTLLERQPMPDERPHDPPQGAHS